METNNLNNSENIISILLRLEERLKNIESKLLVPNQNEKISNDIDSIEVLTGWTKKKKRREEKSNKDIIDQL